MRRVTQRQLAITFAAVVTVLLLLNHRWYRAKDRAEAERLEHSQQRERLLADAQHANRAKDLLLANVSHELRMPLNVISGWAVMMLRAEPGPEDVRRAAEAIKRNAEALARGVDQLLDVSLANAGRIRSTRHRSSSKEQ